MRRGESAARLDSQYQEVNRRKRACYASPRYPMVPLGKLATFIQYGISERANTAGLGVPMIRMNNLQTNGWDLSDLKHIELDDADLDRYRLLKGDLLFNRTNSKELVGKCEAFGEDGDWVFASYLIRVRLDTQRAVPGFVSAFLNSPAGRIQIDQVSRQVAGMSNVNAEELRDLLIPLPDTAEQERLLAELEAARVDRDQKLAEAAALDDSFDSYLMQRLGLVIPGEQSRRAFSVRLRDVLGARIDPPAYQPLLSRGAAPTVQIRRLEECVVINGHTVPKPASDDVLVPYVGLPECNLTSIREVVMRPYGEVKGRAVAKPGDVLFARIEPSIFNKKYVLADDLKGHAFAYTSTEFYVVTPIESVSIAEYVHAMFFCSFVYLQTRGMTTGSSGRRRLDSGQFRTLKLPLAEASVQREIADEAVRRRVASKQLVAHAEAIWQKARERFAQQLLKADAP